MTPLLWAIGAVIFLGLVIGVGWFAVRIEGYEEDEEALQASAKALTPGLNAEDMDETFAHDMAARARDKGAV